MVHFLYFALYFETCENTMLLFLGDWSYTDVCAECEVIACLGKWHKHKNFFCTPHSEFTISIVQFSMYFIQIILIIRCLKFNLCMLCKHVAISKGFPVRLRLILRIYIVFCHGAQWRYHPLCDLFVHVTFYCPVP